MQSLCCHDQPLAQALLLSIQGENSVPGKRHLEKNSGRESTSTLWRVPPSSYWNKAQPYMWMKTSSKSQPAARSWCSEPWFLTATCAHGAAGSAWSATACPQCRDRSRRMICCSGSPAGSSPFWCLLFGRHRSQWKQGSGHCSTPPAAGWEHLMFYSREKLDFKWQCIRLCVG